jgi:hypothetical protein
MIRRLRLCFPFAGLLVAALLFFTGRAEAQVKPPPRGEALPGTTPPPSTRRCRYVQLAQRHETTRLRRYLPTPTFTA